MRLLRNFATFAFFLALASLLTWPLAAHLSTTVIDRGDPMLNAFILDWVCHALTHSPLHLFNAPIFFPTRLALALSEHMTGIALLVLPFHLVGMGAVALHSTAMLLSFALSGYGAYVLARIITADAVAALIAGTFYAFVSFKFDHLAHVQVIASGWIPLTLAALLLFWRSGSVRHAALFAAAFTMNGLSNVYWLLFTGVAVVATIVFLEGCGRPFHRRRLAVALLASVVVLLPFLMPYKIVSSTLRMSRTSFEAARASATWSDWIAPSSASALYGRMGGGAEERHLFPGLLPIVLAVVGVVPAARAAAQAQPVPRRRRTWLMAAFLFFAILGTALLPWHRSDVPFMVAAVLAVALLPLRRLADPIPWVGVLWVAIGFIGSFGERSFLHSSLFRLVEPFRATRTPARWAIITYCGLAILAAIGASRFRKLRYVLLALAVIEVIPRITWSHVPATFPPVYGWLANARPAAVIELPIGWNEQEAGYVLASSVHRVPIMNGVSGFDPPLHEALSRHAYDEAMLELISSHGVDTVIVHRAAAERARPWVDTGRLIEAARFPDGDVVYRIRSKAP